jgi:hypothetical protein
VNRFYKLRGERGYAGEALDEIECDTFSGKYRPSAARHTEQACSAFNMLAVGCQLLEMEIRGGLVERCNREGQACHHEVFPCDHRSLGDGVFRHGGEGGGVAGADVFRERSLHGAADFFSGQRFHAVRVSDGRRGMKKKVDDGLRR